MSELYLMFAQGFDQMIEASKSGLPVDLAQVRQRDSLYVIYTV